MIHQVNRKYHYLLFFSLWLASTGIWLLPGQAMASVQQSNNPPEIQNLERNVISIASTDNVNITSNLTIEDADSEMMTGAEVKFIEDTYDQLYDRLLIGALVGGISAEWDSSNGILTLKGVDTKANYQQALRNVIYSFSDRLSFAPADLNKIAISVTDGNNYSESEIRYIAVKNPTYTPAWLSDFGKQVNEDQNLSFVVADFKNNYLPDQNRFNGIDIRNLPSQGSLIFGGDTLTGNDITGNGGSFRIAPGQINQLVYRPDENYSGTDSFVWNSYDGTDLATSDALVNITITEVNDPPVITAPAEIIDIPEDNVAPLAGISVADVDDTNLRLRLEVTNGTLTIAAAQRSGLTFATGDGDLDKIIVFSGPIANINAALSSLNYLSDQDYAGPDNLLLTLTDQISGGTPAQATAEVALTIIQTNDPPRLANLPESALTYTEGDAPQALFPNVTISDDEGDDVQSMVVSFSQGYVANEDSLYFTQTEGITVQQNNNQLTFTGNASVGVYQQLLRSVTYKNTSNNPNTASRQVSVQLTDNEDAQSDAISRGITIISIDDPSVLSNLETQTLNFVQFAGPVRISGNITVDDIDNENINRAVISLDEASYQAGQDILSFENTTDITGQWNESNGVLTLSGSATLAQYTEALRQVLYENTSESPDTSLREMTIQVFNGEVGSNTLSRDIAIVVNERPTITSFEKATEEDTPLALSVQDFNSEGNYQDPDNFPSATGFSRIAILKLPSSGSLIVGQDTLTQEDLSDQTGYEIPRDSLSKTFYLPSQDYNGQDSLTWNAFDGAQYALENQQINITITPVDDAPVVSPIALTLAEDDTLRFDPTTFREAYSDAEDQPIQKVIIRSAPTQGKLELNGISVPANTEISMSNINQLQYIPEANYNGNDAFSWAATDGALSSEEAARVSLTITPVNDAPVIENFTIAIEEGDQINFSLENFSSNYIDVENDELAFITIESLPENGQLLLGENPVATGNRIQAADINNMIYRHNPDDGVRDSFIWRASDGSLLSQDSAIANIIIGIGVTEFDIAVNEDEVFTFSPDLFLNSYGNPDGELQAIRIDRLPVHGILALGEFPVTENQVINMNALEQVTYTPDTNFFGLDSLIWNATDGNAFSDESAGILITVNSVNDLPTITDLDDLILVAGNISEPATFTIGDVETAASELVVTATSDNQNIVSNDQISLSGTDSARTITVFTNSGTDGIANIILTVDDGETATQTTFRVTVYPYSITLGSGEDIETCSNAPVTLTAGDAEGGQGLLTYNWTCDQEDCQIQDQYDNTLTVSPTVTTNYFVQVVDENGITSNQDTITVSKINCSAIELNIPNGFTPNGDGIHDSWEIENIDYVDEVTVQVFNRSGQEIFFNEGYDTPWDGTYQNNLLPVGTYYYAINISNGARVFRGSVTILR